MQETLLTAGMSGLNLAVVFHEVERGVRALNQIITEGGDLEEAARQVQGLMRILGGFSSLLRRDRKRRHSAVKLVDRARQFNLLRFRHHRVSVVCPLADGDGGFDADFSFGLVLGALNNLIDNALYWLRVRWPDPPADRDTSKLRLFVSTSHDFAGGPAIVHRRLPARGSRATLPNIWCVRSSRASLTAWVSDCTMRTWRWS